MSSTSHRRQASFSGKSPPRKPKNVDVRPREYLSEEEVHRLIQAAKGVGRYGHRDAALILLTYRHGLRVSEVIARQWAVVDLKQGRLHVHRLKDGIPAVHPLREASAIDQSPAAEVVDSPAPSGRRRGHGRRRLPDSLPLRRIIHELSEAERSCPCCGKQRAKVSEEISEQLEFQPAAFYVNEHVRYIYACQDENCTASGVTAPKPPQPIDKGLAGTTTVRARKRPRKRSTRHWPTSNVYTT